MCVIMTITNKKGEEFKALLDLDDWLQHCNGVTWYVTHYGYVARKNVSAGKLEDVRLHRQIMQPSPGMFVDHINGNRLDNRRENLRVCTPSENVRNQKRSSTNTSGFKGVYWDKNAEKWKAQIQSGGKKINLGHYQTPEAAHQAYCSASKKYHGEFGRTK